MAYVSDWTKPGELIASMGKPFFSNLKPTKADFYCFSSLFFDNLSTMVGTGGAFVFVAGAAAGQIPQAQDLLYKRMVPACGMMLFLGNTYMAWLATRMKTKFGKDYCAQPYGINTVGAFPFIFNIMLPVAASTGSIETAWKVGCTGNFIVGLINVALGILFGIPAIGNAIIKYVPIAALTIPVAGVGLTWLCMNQIAPCFGSPVAGFLPLFLMMVAYYSGGGGAPIKIGGFSMPLAAMWVIPGYALGWAYGLPAAAAEGWTFTYNGGGLWAGGAAFQGFDQVGDYIGTILPLAIAATAGDLMCLFSAQFAKNPYPIGETLIVDGIFTIIGSLFGSPFGTVVYFGHPVHKRIGGKYFYSFFNGVVYLILTLSGLFELVDAVSPKVAIGPTIAIFGFMLAEECTAAMPQRHHAIIFFALFFGYCDYFKSAGVLGLEETSGIEIMRKGPIFNSMLWAAMLVYAMDQRWGFAAAVAFIASIFALLGITHQDSIDFDLFTKGSTAFTGGNTGRDAGDPRYSTSPLQICIAYLTLCAACLFYKFFQKTEPIMVAADEKDEMALKSKQITVGSYENWWAASATEELPVKAAASSTVSSA